MRHARGRLQELIDNASRSRRVRDACTSSPASSSLKVGHGRAPAELRYHSLDEAMQNCATGSKRMARLRHRGDGPMSSNTPSASTRRCKPNTTSTRRSPAPPSPWVPNFVGFRHGEAERLIRSNKPYLRDSRTHLLPTPQWLIQCIFGQVATRAPAIVPVRLVPLRTSWSACPY